jgi:hypothetical protein
MLILLLGVLLALCFVVTEVADLRKQVDAFENELNSVWAASRKGGEAPIK